MTMYERWSPGFENPNEFAAALVFLGFASLDVALLRLARHWLQYLVITLIGLMIGHCLGWTYSRGGVVALFGGTVLFMAIAQREQKMKVLLFSCAVIVGLVAVPSMTNRVSSIADISEAPIRNRLEVWKSSVVLLAHHPLGVGKEVYPRLLSWGYPPERSERRGATYATAINTYLTIGCWWGIPSLCGSVAFLVLLVGTLVDSKQLGKAVPGVGGLGIGLFAMAIAAFFSPFLYSYALAALVAVAFVTAAFLAHPLSRSRSRKLVFLAGGSALGIAAGLIISGFVIANVKGWPRVELTRERVIMSAAGLCGDRTGRLLIICGDSIFAKELVVQFARPLFHRSRLQEIDVISESGLRNIADYDQQLVAIIAFGNNAAVGANRFAGNARALFVVDESTEPRIATQVLRRLQARFLRIKHLMPNGMPLAAVGGEHSEQRFVRLDYNKLLDTFTVQEEIANAEIGQYN